MLELMTVRQSRAWALPSLAGRGWWVFMAVWSALFAACLIASVMVLPETVRNIGSPLTPRDAIGLRVSLPIMLRRISTASPAATRAGLARGDEMLLIDGRPAAMDAAALDRQLAGPEGSRVTIVTRSAAGAVGRHVLIRSLATYRRDLAAVGLTPTLVQILLYSSRYLFGEVLLITCATLLMVKRARDPLAPWASLMMLGLVVANASAGFWLADRFPDPTIANYVLNAFGFSMLIIVLSAFPTGRFEPRWSLFVAVLGTLATIVSEPMSQARSNTLLLVALLAAVVAIVIRYRRMPPGTGRQQIRWALFGFAASMVALLLLVLTQFGVGNAESTGAQAWLRVAGSVSAAANIFLVVIGITVSLMRYRLYDADATISRSIVYGGVTLGLLATFAGSEKLIEIMGEEYFGERLGALAGAIGAGAAAVMIVPLHHRVTHWAEKRFRSGLAHLRNGLPLLVGDMRETATPHALAQTMLTRVETGVRAGHGAVIVQGDVLDVRDIDPEAVETWRSRVPLADDRRTLQCDRADPLFPVRLPLHADGPGLVGWLLLGPRPDGSFYGREEREALREIADPVARALAIAVEREQRDRTRHMHDEQMRREIGDLRGIIAEISGRLGIGTRIGSA